MSLAHAAAIGPRVAAARCKPLARALYLAVAARLALDARA
jgi:hypothetical protein